MRHVDTHNILHDAQHGFRRRRSCENQLILTVQDLARNIVNRNQTDLILLDFSKAFDEMAKIPKSDQSQNTSRKYKSEK
jgi:hypothetical protein